MLSALLWGFGIFGACWLTHCTAWRIRKPAAYLIWLPVIFLVLPLAAVALLSLSGGPLAPTGTQWFRWALGGLLHVALSCCYICGYAGITEYSPSAEVLLAVSEHMPHGIAVNQLHVRSFTEYCLTGKRIDDLYRSGLIVICGDKLNVTALGRFALGLCRRYRLLTGVDETGNG